jgi:hypothetical protein
MPLPKALVAEMIVATFRINVRPNKDFEFAVRHTVADNLRKESARFEPLFTLIKKHVYVTSLKTSVMEFRIIL